MIVLIGGASHAGKSTLCGAIGALDGWDALSTDTLGRHPGRPWRPAGEQVQPHVAEHYLSLSPEQLLADVLDYQRMMWPTIERIIERRLGDADAPNLVFQGSALLPEKTGAISSEQVRPVCLTASGKFLEARIRRSSDYDLLSGAALKLVDKFMARNALMNRLYVQMAEEHGVQVIDVGTGISVDELSDLLIHS